MFVNDGGSPVKEPETKINGIWLYYRDLQKKIVWDTSQSKWSSLPPHYLSWHRNISPGIPPRPWWFCGVSSPRRLIVAQFRLRLGHNRLPIHIFYLTLNSSPLCTLHLNEIIYDLKHIQFDYPSLSPNRNHLLSRFCFLGYFFPNTYLILSSSSPLVIFIIFLCLSLIFIIYFYIIIIFKFILVYY